MNLKPTHNDLPASVRQPVVELLQRRLVDLIDLQAHARQAHWNVKGPTFIMLHELFGTIVDGLDEPVDDVAERIVQLGGTPSGTAQTVAKTSSLPEYPASLVSGPDHLKAVLASLATVAKSVRADVRTTDEQGDADTSDLLLGISRKLDKWVWFVESHLQGER
ncbi:MAG: DNA starvation/stationary phase protection protein Dps [Tepidisphaerales bacterium]